MARMSMLFRGGMSCRADLYVAIDVSEKPHTSLWLHIPEESLEHPHFPWHFKKNYRTHFAYALV